MPLAYPWVPASDLLAVRLEEGPANPIWLPSTAQHDCFITTLNNDAAPACKCGICGQADGQGAAWCCAPDHASVKALLENQARKLVHTM